MNILFITALPLELNTSSMLRNISLIKGLTKNGCDITVLAAQPNTYSVFYDGIDLDIQNVKKIKLGDNNKTYSFIDKIKQAKKNKLIGLLRKVYKSLSLFGSTKFLLKHVKDVKFDNKHFDLIISSSGPKTSHLLAKKCLKNKIDCNCWVQYWGDPLLIDITDTSKLPKWYKKHVEYNILKDANKIIYVSPLTLEIQKKIYKSLAGKMYFLPVPYQSEIIYPPTNNKKLRIGYFGNYNFVARDISPLYDAVKNNCNSELIIAGDSEMNLSSTDNITIYPRVSREKVQEMESLCDVLVCVTNKTGAQIPSKIYYYAATNKNILVILDGNAIKIKEYLSTYNRFEFCKNTVEDIQCTLQNYLTKSLNSNKPVKELSSSFIARKLIEIANIMKG
jgi:hypothetical protein